MWTGIYMWTSPEDCVGIGSFICLIKEKVAIEVFIIESANRDRFLLSSLLISIDEPLCSWKNSGR